MVHVQQAIQKVLKKTYQSQKNLAVTKSNQSENITDLRSTYESGSTRQTFSVRSNDGTFVNLYLILPSQKIISEK